ncbi:uncharacterized protein PAC_12649 [Phialocephala subalpina]|uniref:Uncharacterized protein n=1 Tax=Phialocephala subalpina TaxID=576137 RepID=A0A1L7XCK9_9HELO|nr:uncharacterized protein PAC_12649 [Phialocephala subalpina]
MSTSLITANRRQQAQDLFVLASSRGRLLTVQVLSGLSIVNINAANQHGWNALASAIHGSHVFTARSSLLATVEYLIKTKNAYTICEGNRWSRRSVLGQALDFADQQEYPDSEDSALAWVVFRRQEQIMEMLLRSQAGQQQLYEKHKAVPGAPIGSQSSKEAVSRSGWNALQVAAGNGHEVVRLLVDKKDDFVPANYNWQPLCAAALAGHLNIVSLLLEDAELYVQECFADAQTRAEPSGRHNPKFVQLVLSTEESDIVLAFAKAAAYGSPSVTY